MNYIKGVAFVLEGDTEKIFYTHLIQHYCTQHPEYTFNKRESSAGDEIFYELKSPERSVLIKMNAVGTISQITNSGTWFENTCHRAYRSLPWTVFLCYDTDDYQPNITKFYSGDWDELRKSLIKSKAKEVIDLAASADIEDLMLLDTDGIFCYANQTPRPIPYARKGKPRLKLLFRSFGRGIAYQEGNRAKPLIEALDMDKIIQNSPVLLSEVERVIFH